MWPVGGLGLVLSFVLKIDTRLFCYWLSYFCHFCHVLNIWYSVSCVIHPCGHFSVFFFLPSIFKVFNPSGFLRIIAWVHLCISAYRKTQMTESQRMNLWYIYNLCLSCLFMIQWYMHRIDVFWSFKLILCFMCDPGTSFYQHVQRLECWSCNILHQCRISTRYILKVCLVCSVLGKPFLENASSQLPWVELLRWARPFQMMFLMYWQFASIMRHEF